MAATEMTEDAMQNHNRDEAKKLWELIKDIEVCMMTTIDGDGSLRSRPMWSMQNEFEGELWFFTRASAHKNLEIDAHHQVNLSFADPEDQDYVSISGSAALVRDPDKARELWSEPLRTWFPKGVDDPDLALLRVTVDKAEYWDSPSSAMVYLYGYAKARLTGKPPHPGDNAKLNFH